MDGSNPHEQGDMRMAGGEFGLEKTGLVSWVDTSTLTSITGALLLTVIAIVVNGSAFSFVNISGLLIVLGGTILITVAGFSWSDLVLTIKDLSCFSSEKVPDPRRAALGILYIADYARIHGLVKLQRTLQGILRRDHLLYKGLTLLLEGEKTQDIRHALLTDILSIQSRRDRTVSLLRRAAETSPAMGLIGTLIGLVQMLGRLEDPTSIGPGMSMALLTTFYGAVIAYMIVSPLAARLERNSQDENLTCRIWLTGLMAIAHKESKNHLEMQIDSILPPEQRWSETRSFLKDTKR